MSKKTDSRWPTDLNRDHARCRGVPAPSNEALSEHITEIVAPSTFALSGYYHDLGLRWRILNLPVMVALVLTMIWRQVPSVSSLVSVLKRETLLWSAPTEVSQQALSLRIRSLPHELFERVFGDVVPKLRERAKRQKRPSNEVVEIALSHFKEVLALDATNLEALFKKVGLLREVDRRAYGGKLLALLDVATKLPVRLWLTEDERVNEKSFLEEAKSYLNPETLLLMDRGFYSFGFFDWLSENEVSFITRARSLSSYRVERVISERAGIREMMVRFGVYRSNQSSYPLRMIEITTVSGKRAYLTNVSEEVLKAEEVAGLYGERWRVEEAFLLVKRLLGLSYLWTGAYNGIAMQVWATWLLYAVLIDLCAEIAEELGLPLERISVEMVYRGLYHFTVAYERGEANDPVTYLAHQSDLGIVKRKRKYRDKAKLDKLLPNLNL
jgi:hypothetical protein